jgi:paraquat-inducible protein A
MLGALVALVKLAALAQVVPGIALFSYGALMLTLAALTSITPTEQFWQWVERRHA